VALIEFLWDGWRPYSAVLGRVGAVKGYHDLARHPEARVVPGLVLFRWDAPLFFANAEQFRRRVQAALAEVHATPVRSPGRQCRTGDQHRRDLGRHAGRTGPRAARGGHRAVFCRGEGPGEGQAASFGLFAQMPSASFPRSGRR
jgi:hypothetical protein